MEARVLIKNFRVGLIENLVAAKIEGNWIKIVVFQFLIAIVNYQYLSPDAFIRETILKAVKFLLKIGGFVSFLKLAVYFLKFEIGGFVSFKIGCFVVPQF